MENDKDHIAISYHDVLIRNGFAEISPDQNIDYQGGYVKMLHDGQAIFIDNRTNHWLVSHCNLIVQNADTLKPIHLSKKTFKSLDERNEDVNDVSRKELNEFFLKMPLELELK